MKANLRFCKLIGRLSAPSVLFDKSANFDIEVGAWCTSLDMVLATFYSTFKETYTISKQQQQQPSRQFAMKLAGLLLNSENLEEEDEPTGLAHSQDGIKV